MRGRAALDDLLLDILQQALARATVSRIGRGCIYNAVGVNEDHGAGGKIIKRHGNSTSFHRDHLGSAATPRDRRSRGGCRKNARPRCLPAELSGELLVPLARATPGPV